MREYSYKGKWQELLTPQIVNYLTAIHEYRGRQELIATRHTDILDNLIEIAKIQSTESSNKIEGIYTSDERLKKIVLDKTTPHTRNEYEIAAYTGRGEGFLTHPDVRPHGSSEFTIYTPIIRNEVKLC